MSQVCRVLVRHNLSSRFFYSINCRNLSSTSENKEKENDLGVKTGMYKPSTAKQETSIPDDLHSGQPIETLDSPPRSTATLTGNGKVWSVQNHGSVHVAPLSAARTTYVPTESENKIPIHQTTVHTEQGQSSTTGSLNTPASQTQPTPGELAEAAAASAFEPFEPGTPLATSVTSNTVFAPKIASTDIHSSTTSPTAHYQNIDSTTSSTDKDSSSTDKSTEIPIQRESDIRNEILRASLKYVQDKGWTMEAIRAGVRDCNQPTTVEGLFSNGYDLVDYFIRDANAKMATYMNEKAKKGDLQGNRLLTDGLKYRLGLIIPYGNTWDQALAQGALPQNAMRSWKNLLDLSSDAWHAIGDTATDINWYSKRLLLAAVYKSAEIYMLQDQSMDKMETMQFLERRLSDFQAFGSVRNTVSKSFSDGAQIVSGLFSVVRNLTSRR